MKDLISNSDLQMGKHKPEFATREAAIAAYSEKLELIAALESAPHHSHHHKHDFTKGKEDITLIGNEEILRWF